MAAGLILKSFSAAARTCASVMPKWAERNPLTSMTGCGGGVGAGGGLAGGDAGAAGGAGAAAAGSAGGLAGGGVGEPGVAGGEPAAVSGGEDVGAAAMVVEGVGAAGSGAGDGVGVGGVRGTDAAWAGRELGPSFSCSWPSQTRRAAPAITTTSAITHAADRRPLKAVSPRRPTEFYS